MPRKRDRTDELVAQLKEQLSDLRAALDRAHNDAQRAHNDAETWRNAFEDMRRLALPAPRQEPRPAPPDAAATTPWRRFLGWRKAG